MATPGVPTYKVSTRAQKIAWLLAHTEMWEGWSADHDARKRAIVEAMRADGLIAASTYWPDVSINNLIQDARAVHRGQERSRL